MDDKYEPNNEINGDDAWEYSLEAILAEYASEAADTPATPETARSREIVMEALGDQIAASMDSRVASPPEETARETKPRHRFVWMRDSLDGTAPAQRETPETPEDDREGPEAVSDSVREAPEAEEVPEAWDEAGMPEPDTVGFTGDEEEYAAADYPPYDDEEPEDAPDGQPRGRSGSSAGRLSPLVALLAALLIRRRQRAEGKSAASQAAARAQEAETQPEPSLKKASKYYLRAAVPYRLRFMACIPLCLILLYISLGYGTLPMLGAMKNLQVCAGMCLVLELSVMMLGLDVFTTGLLTLVRGRPGLEALVTCSCIFSALDALIILLGGPERGLPFCAVSALSMACALLSSRLRCRGLARSFRAAASAAEPWSVTAEEGVLENNAVLIKSRRSIRGFVRRSQEPDISEDAYSLAAPILLVAALVLAFLATVCRGQAGDFFHCLSALIAVSASFSAFLCFPLPFAVTARALAGSGAALAGWAGCADIGESRRIVVTDEDVFPPGNVLIDTIRILEGVYTDKVISYAGSVIAASGCGMAPAFIELMRRNGCAMQQVENFSCHKGGGLTAIVRGEQVFVGSSSFMNLMGIRLPQSQMSKTSVFVAISGQLVGVFAIRYVPTASVQEALVTLLRSRGGDPLFAIRDFNVTPLLIKQRFRMPTEGFAFPAFPERYRISALGASENALPAALLSRNGLAGYVEAVQGGRRVYNACRLCLLVSLLGSVLGELLMFFLCAGASYDSATVSNMLIFMLLWLVPLIIVTLGLRR